MARIEKISETEKRLEAVQNLIIAGAELIDEQVRRAKLQRARGEAAEDAAHTLEVMIDVQAAHMMYRDMLLKALRRGAR